mmetsp:Transcript_32265/g.57895  ORF Transcript_32265/g.57895 Transcript_32265/m.57895 type:complete len:106 (-) Transcript_32265:1657-1974(-)
MQWTANLCRGFLQHPSPINHWQAYAIIIIIGCTKTLTLTFCLTLAESHPSIKEETLNNALNAWPFTGAFVEHTLCPPEEIPPKMMAEGSLKAGKECVAVHLQFKS